MGPFDDALRKAFDALSPQQWADLLRNGLERVLASIQRGELPHDYSDFGLAEVFVANKPPVTGLLQLYEQLGAAQSRFRGGIRLVLEGLRAPPAAETLLIISQLMQVASGVRATELIDVLIRRCRVTAWRTSAETYHASMQFIFGVATHSASAQLVRSLVGKAGQRSPEFKLEQIPSCIRAMTCSDPRHLGNHVLFFEPEAASAPPDIRERIVTNLTKLSDEQVSHRHWKLAKAKLPHWFIAVENVVAGSLATAEMVGALIDQAFTAAKQSENEDTGLIAQARKSLGEALLLAADRDHEVLVWTVNEVHKRVGNPQTTPSWVEATFADYRGHISRAFEGMQHIREAQDFIGHLNSRSDNKSDSKADAGQYLRLVRRDDGALVDHMERPGVVRRGT